MNVNYLESTRILSSFKNGITSIYFFPSKSNETLYNADIKPTWILEAHVCYCECMNPFVLKKKVFLVNDTKNTESQFLFF